uniref:Uncharacterized protein n=1 Tax=Xenopus tropicalis TaxID=8364 RepID=F6ZD41_XENTR
LQLACLTLILKSTLLSAVVFFTARGEGAKLRRPVFSGSILENWPIGTKVNGINIHLNRINQEPWCSKVPGRKWHLQLLGEGKSHFEIYFHHRYAQLSLKTTQILDRELKSIYMFRLGLCCKLCLSQENIAAELAFVTVHVLDVNDNAPQFTPPNVTVSRISLDETTGLKSVVYRVSAEDADQGSNADIKPINLTIFAKDRGQPPLVSSPLEVEICPRRSPVLPDSYYAVSLPEDAIVGTVVTTLDPKTFDAPLFELISPSADSPIAVNRESGEITLFRTLDRESAGSHQCLIKVLDRMGKKNSLIGHSYNTTLYYYYKGRTVKAEGRLLGGDDRFAVDRSTGWIQTTGLPLLENKEYLLTVQAADMLGKKSAPIVVSVIAGLRPPQFKKASYSIHVPENVSPGYVLLTVSALSHQNKSISYSLVRNPENLFSVHQLTGAVTLIQSVDYEREPKELLLVVRAMEHLEQLSSTAEVHVFITDVNDCIPEFQQTIYSKDNVAENAAVMTSLLQVMATDCDSGFNSEVSYYTESADFSISAQGIISPVRALDYERPGHLYEFVILAVDKGDKPNTGTATVRIRISNVNDEAPEFSQTIYRTFVSEDASPNTLIATVHAFDGDGDWVTYDIVEGNKDGNFVIDPQKGLIRLHSSLLPSHHETEYILYVTATDDNSSGGPSSLTSTATVIVSVDDINNNKPVFHKCASYRDHAAVLENQPPGTFVLQVEAKDADYGVNGQVKYGMVHKEGTLPAFSIHPDTGIITTVQSFDREKQKEYPITIKATDQAAEPLIGLCQINILILDENDNDPSFENNRYEYFLREDTSVGTSFLQVAAHDADYGSNASITYATSGEEPMIFKVNSSTGWLYVNHSISRVIATDGGNRSTKVEVAVRVTDAQNQPPVWEKGRYEIVVPENTVRDTAVVTVKATSLLGDPRVTYNLEEGLVPESNMPVRFYLTVNREEGSASVLIAEPLDYETTKNFILTIRAQNVAPVPLAAFTTVYINVTDVNDNVPFFTSSIYEASVTEGLGLGTFVLQVSATDQDLGLNGEITYSILEDRNGDHVLFHIDPQTGSIFTASVFDRETRSSYLLEIKSSDGSESARPGKHGQPNSDTAYVRIFISDVNDNKPSFTQSAYYVNVDEDQDVGYIVITVTAHDPDEGVNAKIRYQITAGNIGGVLDMDPDTGSIFIFQPLDYEEVQIYELTLLASDGKWEDFATVTINVINKNDEAPVFSHNEYHGHVTEEQSKLPVLVMQVSASDPDNGAHGSLKYSLHGKGANNIFTIDEERGNVFVQKALDREEHGLWRFVVLATDEEGEGLTGFADVIIYVVDINDNAPQFTCALSSCNANVYENAPPNTTVLEMTAVDADDKNEEINAILTYSMLNNTMNLFSINANTGTIYTLGNLDREKNDKYVLLVKVIDGGGLATTGTATISVLDINDHVPRFTQDSWNSVILETNDINTKVLEVSASDEDIGENALLTFSIIDGDPDQKFTIESDRMTNQAEIKLKKKLDYENPQERWFNLTIKVEDPDFSSLSFCFIELQDCNDNAPVFLAPFVQLSPVLENVTIGTVLTQVIASDADSGINGQIRYSIWPSSDVLGEFFVDPAGFVKVKKALDREVDSQYHLVILASDEGFPSQTGSATVSFSLLDVNDNGPVFDGLYTPVIWENTAWPQIVHMNESSDLLYASDYDTLENGPPFRFSLPSEYTNSTDFLLNDNGNNTATVHALRAFDREKDKEFYLPIIITDSGNPPMSATNMLLITIGDENDNPHRGGHKDVYINSYGGKVKHGTGLGKVFAPDEDDWDNKTYTSVSKMPVQFRLNQNNGSLVMLEKAHQGTYDIKIKVSDGVWPEVMSTVRIHVKDITKEAILNSVSLRLTNEYGFSTYEQLQMAIAAVVPAHPSNVQIFSLENTEGHQTDMRFAVRESSTFYKPDVLQSVLSAHRGKIQSILKSNASYVEVDFCLPQDCGNAQECTSYSAFTENPSLVDTGRISFVSVAHNANTICRCSLRDRVHQSCSSMLQNPCLNGGTCRDTNNGYRCHCLPQFHGPLCQQTQRTFNGNGYAWFPPIRHCTDSHLSLEFISDKHDGLLLYSGPIFNQPSGNDHNFFLGGVKESTPPSYRQLPYQHFKGCLRNVILNKQMYDLGVSLESINSFPGCSVKDPACSLASPCEVPPRCTKESGLTSCDCLPNGSGYDCEKDVNEYYFQLGSSVHYQLPHVLPTQRTYFNAMVRTRHANSIILSLTSRDRTEYIQLQVLISYNIGDGDLMVQLPDHKIDTGEWNEVTMERIQNEFTLRVNQGNRQREITDAPGTYKEIKVDPNSIILGTDSSHLLSFQGCMKDARLNNYRLPMENHTISAVSIINIHGVREGCLSKACKENPCSKDFICIDLWMMHKWYLHIENETKQGCIYTECASTPCKHGTCVAQSPTDYVCHCSNGYAGSKCDVLLQISDPGFGFSIFLTIGVCVLFVIVGVFMWSHCNNKRKNQGVYHVSAYNEELEDTRQNIFQYNEEGGGEEDQDAFNMTELQLSLQSSPVNTLCRTMRTRHLNSPLSCDYHTSISQEEPSQLPPSKPSCSFTSGDFGQYFYDIFKDTTYLQQALSCDSLKIYDMEGDGSIASSLSTLASSGVEEDLVFEEIHDWGPKFGKLSKLYSYTEEDDLQ